MLYRLSLVPRPSPSFPLLAVLYCKQQEAGRGPGNEANIGSKFHWFPPTSPQTFSDTEEDPLQSRPVQTHSTMMKHPPS